MSSQQPGVMAPFVLSDVSRRAGSHKRSAVAEAEKFGEIEEALSELRSGRLIVIADDDDRENEGDLVVAAEMVTAEAINCMATNAREFVPKCAVLVEHHWSPIQRVNSLAAGSKQNRKTR